MRGWQRERGGEAGGQLRVVYIAYQKVAEQKSRVNSQIVETSRSAPFRGTEFYAGGTSRRLYGDGGDDQRKKILSALGWIKKELFVANHAKGEENVPVPSVVDLVSRWDGPPSCMSMSAQKHNADPSNWVTVRAAGASTWRSPREENPPLCPSVPAHAAPELNLRRPVRP